MYLDPHGDVLACCQNTEQLLGNVADHPLLEIWRGAPARELRAALTDYDLGRGCRFCAWQVDDGNLTTTYSRSFEHLPVRDEAPAWPARLELALSNTCNLECVMCNGEWSSRIRARREGRAPLPKVYDDRFFDDLRAFLPHLREVRFLGGEPFLAEETLRVMDLLVDAGLEVPCHLTTNGTQWTPRVERILERLPVSLAVSLDGVSRETVEAVRAGASYDALMDNLARYRAYTLERGTTLDLTFCLMQPNWHEFGAYLRFADELGSRVFVNTVIHPRFGLYHLPLDEFDAVLAGLEAEDEGWRSDLGRNRDVWVAELDRLRAWSARAHREQPVDAPYRAVTPRAVYFQEQEAATLPLALRRSGATARAWREDEAATRARSDMPPGHGLSRLWCDADEVVTAVTGGDGGAGEATFLGVPASTCVGRPFGEVAAALAERHGDRIRPVRDDVVDGAAFRRVVYRDRDGGATYLQVWSFPIEVDGRYAGSFTAAAWTHDAPGWAAASE
ncbi:MAG: radical SAM protein [Acidimicrobiales bacterium]|nr:radical SAM protein [Acidimicrobiales bacterium]